ncbi:MULTISPECIES: 6-pyruvoyl trahydropterin synthase family protein [Prochlorococcus]|uniref:6-carboxy-5,6,7,8-tetrahydropterin synthase n=1 Tax=Prochlorococcus marinus (strain SARG / CCMP1375 / SS120) TaxID=167539 RepID=Q7VE86_PROMA|nr:MULTISPECIES: 6-carboxytetrahydropterin synthase [Prochlorococcus]AAP99173.1 6-pyruvoyl-tetrahydropterin synthase [Prochlorococcus marinus subsp. marinus str. CCMP1375]KGG11557.1 6-pyruvoyl tetrahydrobiopterin synthase [Prochlorococcus marinus str. LG]KGG18489.1 6-pyruvoyl tetrahydrobiopterin synthase [Prochlorococcus marinus str. SS2]KGG22762.1 6-pyruvoyl tetrahydrobiopterin synthase [Prochlorococcus marinus str. SS35]KGG32638.1 6-pyruvoyl tetrahydrobiopterin synthase [Prochlorococcus mari
MNGVTSMNTHGKGRHCVITRRALFSASHQYSLPELSANDNSKQFGKCAIPPGHGHNYELIVSMAGSLNVDGMVLNLSEVKHAIKQQVTSQLDFRCLNQTWPEFDMSKPEGCLPTTEALTRIIWNRLKCYLPLVSLRLYEQPSLWADYLGKNMEAFLTIKKHFSAAHRLAREELSQKENEMIYGKCARTNGHGHNYFVEITVKGTIDKRTGMLCDLASLEQLVEDLVIEPFDHTFLNKDITHFSNCVPTAENIALHIADILNNPIHSIGASLHKIRLQESPNNAAEIYTDITSLNDLKANTYK